MYHSQYLFVESVTSFMMNSYSGYIKMNESISTLSKFKDILDQKFINPTTSQSKRIYSFKTILVYFLKKATPLIYICNFYTCNF